MYFCNLFVPWGLFAASSSLQKLLFSHHLLFLSLSLPPLPLLVELQWRILKSCHCRFHVKNGQYVSLRHYRKVSR